VTNSCSSRRASELKIPEPAAGVKELASLFRYSIAAKRYALYEKTGTSDITIADPKAHGIGFLYPPQDSPKHWDKEVPRWI
jgi:hypothetical protein